MTYYGVFQKNNLHGVNKKKYLQGKIRNDIYYKG